MSQPQLPASQPPLQNYSRREEGPFYLGWAIVIADIVLLTIFIWVLFIKIGGGDIHFNLFKSKPEQVVDALKDAGLKIDSTTVYTKEQFINDYKNSTQQVVMVGTLEGVGIKASSVNADGGVLYFSEESDYSKFKGLVQLAGAFATGLDKSGKNYVFAFRDKDRLMLTISGNFSKEETAKYEAAFNRA